MLYSILIIFVKSLSDTDDCHISSNILFIGHWWSSDLTPRKFNRQLFLVRIASPLAITFKTNFITKLVKNIWLKRKAFCKAFNFSRRSITLTRDPWGIGGEPSALFGKKISQTPNSFCSHKSLEKLLNSKWNWHRMLL